jgi:hypothetical protein
MNCLLRGRCMRGRRGAGTVLGWSKPKGGKIDVGFDDEHFDFEEMQSEIDCCGSRERPMRHADRLRHWSPTGTTQRSSS